MKARRLLVGFAALLLLMPLGAAAAKKKKKGPATKTTAGVRKTHWGTNVSLDLNRGSFQFVSNGIPNHSRPAFYAVPTGGAAVPTATTARATPDPTRIQNYSFSIPTKPKQLKTPVATGGGAIGVMISGAVLFNPYEGDGTTVALANNFTVRSPGGFDAPFLDSCNGHPTPMGVYHYHGLPSCVTSQVDQAGGPSHIIGYAFDGYPIYGDRNIKGKAVGAGKLDACNGVTSKTPEFPNGIYHYVLLNVPTERSSLGCYRGEVDPSLTTRGPRAAYASTGSTYYCSVPSRS